MMTLYSKLICTRTISLKLRCFHQVCSHHGIKLWRQIVQTVCLLGMLCQFFSLFISLSWDLHCLSPSLMRTVIILCTGPDNLANEDNCKMKKPNILLIHSSGVMCCSLNHTTCPMLIIFRL